MVEDPRNGCGGMFRRTVGRHALMPPLARLRVDVGIDPYAAGGKFIRRGGCPHPPDSLWSRRCHEKRPHRSDSVWSKQTEKGCRFYFFASQITLTSQCESKSKRIRKRNDGAWGKSPYPEFINKIPLPAGDVNGRSGERREKLITFFVKSAKEFRSALGGGA